MMICIMMLHSHMLSCLSRQSNRIKTDCSSPPDASFGEPSTSSRINSFSPSRSMGPGMYMVIWGPTWGQYHPRLKPFKKSTPLDQPGMARKESGKMPSLVFRLASALNVPLQCRNKALFPQCPHVLALCGTAPGVTQPDCNMCE